MARPTLLLFSLLSSLSLAGCAGGKEQGVLEGNDLDADRDGDGVLAIDDCDDSDPELGDQRDDADCDGAQTAVDCDDQDASSTVEADDADCDGVATTADCDDADASMPSEDADCDGVGSQVDCDDDDPLQTRELSDDDADCDGLPAWVDCDDDDALVTVEGVDGSCEGYARIEARTFYMGCTPGQSECGFEELPVMRVTLTHDYYIGETEVTQHAYETLIGINPSSFTSCGDACPVEGVTWHMAAAYSNELSSAAGLTECYLCGGSGASTACDISVLPYDCDGYRLPTEAEWEGAARCGEDTVYAGSDVASEVAWYSDTSDGTPHPVGGLLPNACGLYDMSGNVAEWVHDWYDGEYYTSDGRTDPEGPETADGRCLRGGSWYFPANNQRVAKRSSGLPSVAGDSLGFRVARTLH